MIDLHAMSRVLYESLGPRDRSVSSNTMPTLASSTVRTIVLMAFMNWPSTSSIHFFLGTVKVCNDDRLTFVW
jgi:hypothetical protein